MKTSVPSTKGGIHLEPINQTSQLSVKNQDDTGSFFMSVETTPSPSRRGSRPLIVDALSLLGNEGIRRDSGNYDYAVLNPIMINEQVGGGPDTTTGTGNRKSSLMSGAISGLSSLFKSSHDNLAAMVNGTENSPTVGNRKNSSMSGAISGLFSKGSQGDSQSLNSGPGSRSNSVTNGAIPGFGMNELLAGGGNRERVYSENSDISDDDNQNRNSKSPSKMNTKNHAGKTRGGNFGGSFVALFQPLPANDNPMSRRGSVNDNIEQAILSCHNSHVDLSSLDQIGAALLLQPLQQPLEPLKSPGSKKPSAKSDVENTPTHLPKSPKSPNHDKLLSMKPLSPLNINTTEVVDLDNSRNTLQTGPISALPPLTGTNDALPPNGSETSRSCGSDGFKVRKVTPEHFGSGWEAALMGWVMVAGGQLYGKEYVLSIHYQIPSL